MHQWMVPLYLPFPFLLDCSFSPSWGLSLLTYTAYSFIAYRNTSISCNSGKLVDNSFGQQSPQNGHLSILAPPRFAKHFLTTSDKCVITKATIHNAWQQKIRTFKRRENISYPFNSKKFAALNACVILCRTPWGTKHSWVNNAVLFSDCRLERIQSWGFDLILNL